MNNTVAKGFNQMVPPAQTITVALDMSKLLHTNIPGTIKKFIANYIKGSKAYTTYRNHTSTQRQFKAGVPQGGALSPALFNIYNADLQPPRAPIPAMSEADDITITYTHTSTRADNKHIHKVFSWTKHLALCSLQTLQNIRAIWTLK